jgi:hypothetical protein
LIDRLLNSPLLTDPEDNGCLEIPAQGIFEEDDFPFPPHILFYYLCASKDIDNNLAINIFKSITLKLPETVRRGACASNSPLRFAALNKDLVRLCNLDTEKYIFFNEVQQCIKSVTTPNHSIQCAALDFALQAMEELYHMEAKGVSHKEIIDQSNKNYRGSIHNLDQLTCYLNLNPSVSIQGKGVV